MEKVASLSQMSPDRGLGVEVGDTKIMLVRDGDEVRAFSAICPHAGAPLAEGAICNGRIICPWHKGAFRLSDGALLEPPPLDGIDRYPVRLEGDAIFVDPTPEPRSPAPEKNGSRTFVIVGAGAAGATAAAALREYGFDGRILLIGREPGLPFDRTSLSKFVISGEMKPEETPPLRPEEFYEEQHIERIESEVARFDVGQREISLADGRKIAFRQALIATGGEPKPLGVPGADKRGVHRLRSRADAAGILSNLRPGTRAVVLGASFIGLEVASCLRAQRAEVTVVAPEKIPFVKQFGERIGRSIRALHESNGVVFLSGAEAARIEGEERVASLQLNDGRSLPADLVVVGVGVAPTTQLFHGIALNKDGGVPVDKTLCIVEGVYAAGDIAAFPLPTDGKPTRIEHWRVAQQHARIAAANMLGRQIAYEDTPFFWTYHYGKNIEYLGHADAWDEEFVFGDVEALNFAALLMQGDRVAAVVACERQRLTCVLAERMRKPLMRDEAVRLVKSNS